MTVTASSRAMLPGLAAAAFAVALVLGLSDGAMYGEEPVLRLRATVAGSATGGPLTIELLRWSTDSERAPLLAALSAPPPPPPPPAPEGRAAGGAGRGGRGGGRGRGPAPPATPAERLKVAIQAAPTVGFIWGDGPTGYSIKYAWHAPSPDGQERIVLATDRRLGAHSTSWPPAVAGGSAEFTVVELRIGGSAAGEGKSSLSTNVVVDSAAQTLALEGYGAAPVLFEVAR